jgi:hypothetical protein
MAEPDDREEDEARRDHEDVDGEHRPHGKGLAAAPSGETIFTFLMF